MIDKSLVRTIVGNIDTIPNDSGITAVISPAFDTSKVDLNNPENVRVMASKAIKIADGWRDLVQEKCDINNLFEQKNYEMYLSLSALACEIYMKAILYFDGKHGGKWIIEHKLNLIFGMLSDEQKEELERKIPELDEELSKIADAYKELRYIFEYNSYECKYCLLFELMNGLHTICETYPSYNMTELIYNNETIGLSQY